MRTGHCGESGFDFTVDAARHSSVSASSRAAASAPTKLGMRFAGFGNRAMPGWSSVGPHLLAQHRLRRQQLGIAAGVVVVTRHQAERERGIFSARCVKFGYTARPPIASIDGAHSSNRSTSFWPSRASMRSKSNPPCSSIAPSCSK